MRDGLIGESICALLLVLPLSATVAISPAPVVGDFNFAIGMCDDAAAAAAAACDGDGAIGDNWNDSSGTVSGEFKIDLNCGLDGDSSEDFLFSSSHVSSLLVP